MFFFKKASNQTTDKASWQDQLPKDVIVRENPRAKKLILRKSPKDNGFVLTLPKRISKKYILSFVHQHTDWMDEQRESFVQKTAFMDGLQIHILDTPYTIRHISTAPRKLTKFDENEIHVHGDIENIHGRITRFLKKHARTVFEEKIIHFTQTLDLEYSKLSIKDTTTRWGSCSSDGQISLSWRLLFAPEFVTDYVIAHEVCHLEHMNHSQNFWDLCQSVCPKMKQAKKWLSNHGETLHRYAVC